MPTYLQAVKDEYGLPYLISQGSAFVNEHGFLVNKNNQAIIGVFVFPAEYKIPKEPQEAANYHFANMDKPRYLMWWTLDK